MGNILYFYDLRGPPRPGMSNSYYLAGCKCDKKCQMGRKSAQKVLGGLNFEKCNDWKYLHKSFLTFLVLSVIVLLYTKKEIIVKKQYNKIVAYTKRVWQACPRPSPRPPVKYICSKLFQIVPIEKIRRRKLLIK